MNHITINFLVSVNLLPVSCY